MRLLAASIMLQNGPLIGGFSITPHATNPLPAVTRAIICSGAGNLDVVMADGTSLTIAVSVNQLLPIAATVVKATSTATGIVGLY